MQRIKLTQGAYALVDDKDYAWLSKWKWFLHSQGYAVRSVRGGTVYMHREIIAPMDGFAVDHRNRDRLDNRRDNLRVCNVRQNQHNRAPRMGRSTAYKGVRWKADRSKWQARITIDGRERHLGYFADEIEAALAYDQAARKHFGDFARLNFGDVREAA